MVSGNTILPTGVTEQDVRGPIIVKQLCLPWASIILRILYIASECNDFVLVSWLKKKNQNIQHSAIWLHTT